MSYIFSVDGDYVNFNGGGNMHRLHSDSNCIAWHFDQTGDLFFDVYDQEYVVKAENIATVVIDGVPLSAASDFPDAIVAIFPGLGGGASPGSSYLVYTALLTQDGTNAPTATILQNTIGAIVWTRAVAGSYVGTLTGAFPAEKTYYIITPNKDFEQAQIVMEQSGQGFPNSVNISTYAGGGGAGQDGNMFQTPIEIRVYP